MSQTGPLFEPKVKDGEVHSTSSWGTAKLYGLGEWPELRTIMQSTREGIKNSHAYQDLASSQKQIKMLAYSDGVVLLAKKDLAIFISSINSYDLSHISWNHLAISLTSPHFS